MQFNAADTDRPGQHPETTTRTPKTTTSNDESLPEASDPNHELPLDVVFELLSNERRRHVMRYLLAETEAETETQPPTETEPQTTLGDLAEHIASIENDKPKDALSSSERKRVYIVLYQCHLPKLDDAGVIEFDQNRKTVARAPRIEHLRSYLAEKGPTETTESAAKYYLGLSLLGTGALVVQSIVFPAAWLSGIILGALFTVVCLAAVDYLRQLEQRS